MLFGVTTTVNTRPKLLEPEPRTLDPKTYAPNPTKLDLSKALKSQMAGKAESQPEDSGLHMGVSENRGYLILGSLYKGPTI